MQDGRRIVPRAAGTEHPAVETEASRVGRHPDHLSGKRDGAYEVLSVFLECLAKRVRHWVAAQGVQRPLADGAIISVGSESVKSQRVPRIAPLGAAAKGTLPSHPFIR